MRLPFTKMQGAGNDFVVLDGLRAPITLTPAQIRRLGDRRLGVGADQILAVEPARSLKMSVQPVVTEILPGGRGYRVRFGPPWTDWPTDDPVADARRMNAWIEAEVRRNPAQYLWVHKRFKTRPPGEPGFYD